MPRWRERERFEVHALERLLEEHHGCVFSLGAGHALYDNPHYLRRAERALAPFANVILLLPSPNREEAVDLLQEARPSVARRDHETEVAHPSYGRLATATVYTKGKTPEQTRDEVLVRVCSTSVTLP
jgi:hypothetical protein